MKKPKFGFTEPTAAAGRGCPPGLRALRRRARTSRTVRRVSIPETSASAMLSASARICLPKRVKARARPTAAIAATPTTSIQRLQRAEMERSHIDAAEHVLPGDAPDLTAGEELDRVADHHGEPDGDQKELERARARAPHRLPDDPIERVGEERRQRQPRPPRPAKTETRAR